MHLEGIQVAKITLWLVDHFLSFLFFGGALGYGPLSSSPWGEVLLFVANPLVGALANVEDAAGLGVALDVGAVWVPELTAVLDCASPVPPTSVLSHGSCLLSVFFRLPF